MIEIKPSPVHLLTQCLCGSKNITFGPLIWQGQHVCVDLSCKDCGKNFLQNIQVGQSILEPRILDKNQEKVYRLDWSPSYDTWLNKPLLSILKPKSREVSIKIIKKKTYKKIVILNCLEFVYGHALLVLLNLQRIIYNNKDPHLGIIVLIQPMFEWMIPKDSIAEIWIVNLSFKDMTCYNENLNKEIHKEFERFEHIFLSKGHLFPTNKNIDISFFSNIPVFNFDNPPLKPRITFVWRQDPGRLWIRYIYILKGFEKLGFKKILLPFHYLRVRLLFYFLHKKFGNNYLYTVAGFGTSYHFPKYIDDARTNEFNDLEEKKLCKIYSESELVIGVHGSSMLLPSAHAGMCVSLMPSKRWGNYAEDILFQETDVRVSAFQRRIIPINISIFEIIDICVNMIKNRVYYLNKFIHNDEL